MIETYAYARAGFLGNPSDGYFGKTISFIIRNFGAQVTLWQSPRLTILPQRCDRVEFVGFEKQVTVSGLSSVLGVGLALLPALAGAPVVETWAGFRPHTPDGLPVLGPGRLQGLFLASGHFRNGILLTPITAAVLTQTILGDRLSIDITPFRVDRNAPKL